MKRSSSVHVVQDIDLNKAGLTIRGYDKEENFVCRLKINARGLIVYSGDAGTKVIADVNWEQLVKKLAP